MASACSPKTTLHPTRRAASEAAHTFYDDPLLARRPDQGRENAFSEPCEHERANFVRPLVELVLVSGPLQGEGLSYALWVYDGASAVLANRS